MQLLMKALEEKISRLLPDKFGQVFDAWANGGAHYIATFDRLPVNKPILLAFSPVDNKRDLTNMSLYDFLFNFYGKSLENLLFIASDNCSTNQVIGKHITLPFIGRASHWFYLAVQQYLEEHKELLGKIHELMKKFSGCAHLHTWSQDYAKIQDGAAPSLWFYVTCNLFHYSIWQIPNCGYYTPWHLAIDVEPSG